MNNLKHFKSAITFLIIPLIFNSCLCQNKVLKQNDFRNIDKLISIYSDSINNVLKDRIIPSFLYENNFDYKPLYWSSMHEPNSLRYLIINKVINIDALNFIVEKRDTLLRTVPSTDSPIPFRKYSFYDLLIFRINELRALSYYKQYKKNVKQNH